MHGFATSWENVLFTLENIGYLELFPLPRSAQGKSFHRLCARFGAVIIVEFYIDDFIFALFIFMKDGKAVNYNGSEIIGLIHLKYGKRTACRDFFFYRECGIFLRSREKVNNGREWVTNPNLLKVNLESSGIFSVFSWFWLQNNRSEKIQTKRAFVHLFVLHHLWI